MRSIVVIIGLADLLLLGLIVVLTGAEIAFSLLFPPVVVLGVALFCEVGAMLGSLASPQEGVISTSNGIALVLLFLTETFVPPELLRAWFLTWLSSLTYFSRGERGRR